MPDDKYNAFKSLATSQGYDPTAVDQIIGAVKARDEAKEQERQQKLQTQMDEDNLYVDQYTDAVSSGMSIDYVPSNMRPLVFNKLRERGMQLDMSGDQDLSKEEELQLRNEYDIGKQVTLDQFRTTSDERKSEDEAYRELRVYNSLDKPSYDDYSGLSIRAKEMLALQGVKPPASAQDDELSKKRQTALGAIDELERLYGRGDAENVGSKKDLSKGKGFMGRIGRGLRGLKENLLGVEDDLLEDKRSYEAQANLVVGLLSQAMGSGTPQEAEAARILMESMPKITSFDEESRDWFNNVRRLFANQDMKEVIEQDPNVEFGRAGTVRRFQGQEYGVNQRPTARELSLDPSMEVQAAGTVDQTGSQGNAPQQEGLDPEDPTLFEVAGQGLKSLGQGIAKGVDKAAEFLLPETTEFIKSIPNDLQNDPKIAESRRLMNIAQDPNKSREEQKEAMMAYMKLGDTFDPNSNYDNMRKEILQQMLISQGLKALSPFLGKAASKAKGGVEKAVNKVIGVGAKAADDVGRSSAAFFGKATPSAWTKGMTEAGKDLNKLIGKYVPKGSTVDDMVGPVAERGRGGVLGKLLKGSEDDIQKVIASQGDEVVATTDDIIKPLLKKRASMLKDISKKDQVQVIDDAIEWYKRTFPNGFTAADALEMKRSGDSQFGKAVVDETTGAINNQIKKLETNMLREKLKSAFPDIAEALNTQSDLLTLRPIMQAAAGTQNTAGSSIRRGSLQAIDLGRPATWIDPILANPKVASTLSKLQNSGVNIQAPNIPGVNQTPEWLRRAGLQFGVVNPTVRAAQEEEGGGNEGLPMNPADIQFDQGNMDNFMFEGKNGKRKLAPFMWR